MARPKQEGLTPREMELMQVLWQHGEVTVEEIKGHLTDQVEGSTIRTLLQIIEDKGYAVSGKRGRANVYRAIVDEDVVQSSALKQMVRRLFGGSPEMLLARLVETESVDMEEVTRLQAEIKKQQKGEQS